VTDLPRITTHPDFPGQATIYLPDYTYWDTQAGACEVGVPIDLLAGLRDAIDTHLGGRTTADNPVASGDGADNPLRKQITAALTRHQREHERSMYCECGAWVDDMEGHRAAAVRAVRDRRMEQLTAERDQAQANALALDQSREEQFANIAALLAWLSTEAAHCRRNADAARHDETRQALGGMAAGCELAVRVIDGMAAGRGLPVSGGAAPTAGVASPWETVQSLNDWLSKDSALPAEVLTLLQILKITEEAGEVAEAVIGATGSNPNKGSSHTWEDVQRELCDTITTAMTALARITPNPQEIFAENLARIATRALGDPACSTPGAGG
jgi:hypothetical protein